MKKYLFTVLFLMPTILFSQLANQAKHEPSHTPVTEVSSPALTVVPSVKVDLPDAVDTNILLALSQENEIVTEYKLELLQLQQKLQPSFSKAEADLLAAIESQKKNKKWGSDITFDRERKIFVKNNVAPSKK